MNVNTAPPICSQRCEPLSTANLIETNNSKKRKNSLVRLFLWLHLSNAFSVTTIWYFRYANGYVILQNVIQLSFLSCTSRIKHETTSPVRSAECRPVRRVQRWTTFCSSLLSSARHLMSCGGRMCEGPALWCGTFTIRRFINICVPLLSGGCRGLMNSGRTFSYSLKQLWIKLIMLIYHVNW